jgi:galactose oxidase-like protein
MAPRPPLAGLLPPALLLTCALAATQSFADPIPFTHAAPVRDAHTLPFVGREMHPMSASDGAMRTVAPLPTAPDAADGVWQEFNLLQVAQGLAAYDHAHDRLLSIGGSRPEGWALPLTGTHASQPVFSHGPREFVSAWLSALDPSTGLVYCFGQGPTTWEIHTLDPQTGVIDVVPSSQLPFQPLEGGLIFDPEDQRLLAYGYNYGNTGREGQVWALDLLPTPKWSQWMPSGTPPPVSFYSTPAVLDPLRRRMVFPPGISFGYPPPAPTIWALTLEGSPEWLHFETNGLPDGLPSSGNPLVYDSLGDRFVTAGGDGELYVLSPETLQWSRGVAHGPGPSRRGGAGIAIDPIAHRLLVCGGSDASYYDMHSDAWVLPLDGPQVWKRLVPDATRAPIRGGAGDGYDPSRSRLVVFGGSDELGGFRNDTWAVDLSGAPSWSALATRGSPPPGRYWHATAWDPVRDALVVFGGHNGDPYHPLGDLWVLSFARGKPAWAQIAPAGAGPAARMLSQLVYDSARDRFLLLFGYDGAHALSDVWELRISSTPAWRQLAPGGAAPASRAAEMCVYDAVRDRVLVFGGGTNSGNLNDMWALNFGGGGDGAWQSLAIPPGPSERNLGLLRLDTTRDRLLLFGGYGYDYFNDAWALDLAGTTAWRQLSPAGFLPAGRDRANGAYDAFRDRLVLACGGIYGANDLWSLSFGDANARTLREPANALALSAKAAEGRIYFAVKNLSEDPATLALFDVAGRRVWSTQGLGPGSHEVEMDAAALPTSIYFARLTQGRTVRNAKVALIR